MWHCSDCHSLKQISSRKTVNEIREANEGGCKSTDVYLQKKKKKDLILLFLYLSYMKWYSKMMIQSRDESNNQCHLPELRPYFEASNGYSKAHNYGGYLYNC